MDVNNLDYFKVISTKMHWLNARQKVLAENVANADTPNYRAKDLQEPDFSQFLAQTQAKTPRKTAQTVSLQATHAGHFGGALASTADIKERARESIMDEKYESTPTDNSVILEEEMIKITKTAGEYAMMANVYKKGIALLKMAVRGSR